MARHREQTAEQRKREGTYRADRHAPDLELPPIAPAGAPKTPPGLTRPERDAWAEIVEAMDLLGLSSPVDATLVEAGACALARARVWAREARRLPAASRLVIGSGGQPKAHPAFDEERKAWREYRAIAAQLGIVKSGKAVMPLPPAGEGQGDDGDDDPVDPLERIAQQIRDMPVQVVE